MRTRLISIRQEKLIKGLLISSTEEIFNPQNQEDGGGVCSVSPSIIDTRAHDWIEVSDEDTPIAGTSSQRHMIRTSSSSSSLGRLQEPSEFMNDLRISAASDSAQINNMELSANRPSWRFYDSEVEGYQSPPRMRHLAFNARTSVRGSGRGRGRGRGVFNSLVIHNNEEEASIFQPNNNQQSSTNLFPALQPPIVDLTMDLETDGLNRDPTHNGYFLLHEPESPEHPPPTGGFHNSEFYATSSNSNPPLLVQQHSNDAVNILQSGSTSVENPDPDDPAVDDVLPVTTPALVELGYDQICHKLIRNSMLLILGVQSSTTFHHHSDDKSGNFSNTMDNIHSERDDFAENLPSAKSSETFRSPESRYYSNSNGGMKSDMQQKEAVAGVECVRRLGRNLLRFVASEVIMSKQDWYSDSLEDPSGWNSEPQCVIKALKQQEERAKLRIDAFNHILELMSTSRENCEDDDTQSQTVNSNEFLSSVHEFLLAGCYQLGLSAPPLQFSPKLETLELEIKVQLAHYLDYVQAAPINLQNQLITVVHNIMRWLIVSIRGFTPDNTSLSSIVKRTIMPFQSEEVKLLNVFALSCRFKAKDVDLVVSSGLLPVLEKLISSTTHVKSQHDLWPGLPLSHYVTLASIRLLQLLTVSTA